MQTYHTKEIADLIGVHPNTVRFYESQELLPPVPRLTNGYRIYSQRHFLSLRLIRLAFHAEILSNNLRNEAIDIVKTSTIGKEADAILKTIAYQRHIGEEIEKAREAIHLAERILVSKTAFEQHSIVMGRREAAAKIGVSMDVLRDWERNGLLQIPRKGNRRQYGTDEMNRLKIIAVLRRANYSQMAIRRMLQKLEQGETDLLIAVDTPDQSEDIISVADRYITSLSGALRDAQGMLEVLEEIKETKRTLQ